MYTLLNSTVRRIAIVAIAITFISMKQLAGQIFIEAEDYSAMKGIDVQGTSDLGGGLNVGWIENTDWMEYEVNIPFTGGYKLSLHVAGQNTTGELRIIESNQDLDTISIAPTGGWQEWETLDNNKELTFTEGMHTIRLYVAKSGFNLNWWTLTLVNPVDSDKHSRPIIVSSASSVHSISLKWNKSTDATSSVSRYKILNNEKYFKMVSDTSTDFDKLAPNVLYNLVILATDLAGNVSDTVRLSISTDTLPWTMQWHDEFDYTGAIDTEKWLFETGGGGWGNSEA